MKKCYVCQQIKPLSDFNKKGDRLQSKCRACQKEWYKQYYQSSSTEKNRLYQRNKASRNEIQNIIKGAKAVPCMDCGVKYPAFVMDFDHRDPEKKQYTISQMTAIGNIELVKEEISKCDVVCSNCHRFRTHKYSPVV